MWILAPILLAVTLTETDSQEIWLDPLRLVTPCSQGLRSDIDNFNFTGTIGKNFSALIRSHWELFFALQISVSSSDFTRLCEILIGIDGNLCNPLSIENCYCAQFNTTTGSAHFVVKETARQHRSGGLIRGWWANKRGPQVFSLNTLTLPLIYDVTQAKIILTLNGIEISKREDQYKIYFQLHADNKLEMCCLNSATPCYPRMIQNGKVFESNTNCVKQTVFVSSLSYTASVEFSYSVCDKTDFIAAGTGVIKTVIPATTTRTTVKIVSSSTGKQFTTGEPRTPTMSTQSSQSRHTHSSTNTPQGQRGATDVLTTFRTGLLLSLLGLVVTVISVMWGHHFGKESTTATVHTANTGDTTDSPPERNSATMQHDSN